MTTGYGLKAGVQIPSEIRNYLMYRIQTGSGTHLSFYPMGIGDSTSKCKPAGV
jgi:hypothetical protein